jgi:hypothetical protein
MDACVCNTSCKFKKHYIWTYHEVPKTHDNEDCVICSECIYIINITQCTCEINMCTCEFLKTSNFIQKIQNDYFEDMKFELYTHTHTIGLIEFECYRHGHFLIAIVAQAIWLPNSLSHVLTQDT